MYMQNSVYQMFLLTHSMSEYLGMRLAWDMKQHGIQNSMGFEIHVHGISNNMGFIIDWDSTELEVVYGLGWKQHRIGCTHCSIGQDQKMCGIQNCLGFIYLKVQQYFQCTCRNGAGSKCPPVLKAWEQFCDNHSKVKQKHCRQKNLCYSIERNVSRVILAHTKAEKNELLDS